MAQLALVYGNVIPFEVGRWKDVRMSPLLGIDAGGSGTRVVLVDGEHVTDLPDGPPMNALLTRDIAGQLAAIIGSAPDVAAIGIGMPGLRIPAEAASLSASLSASAGRPVTVTGDVQIAQAGAFRGGPGIVVIAGTGSNAAGWDGTRWGRAGGHGFLLGDEGSAYWLGRRAIAAALHWADGMGGSAPIHDAVVKTAGLPLDELIVKINTNPSERQCVTPYATVLVDLATEDAEARRLTGRAADHLAALAEAVQRQLAPAVQRQLGAAPLPVAAGGAPLPVAGSGGVFRSPLIWERFAAQTGAIRAQAPPAVGAALLAAAGLRNA
jgi:N-acetylglucosamine kinase-like BadF-type ATPase